MSKQLKEPVNKTDWRAHGAPTTVNAYYADYENSIRKLDVWCDVDVSTFYFILLCYTFIDFLKLIYLLFLQVDTYFFSFINLHTKHKHLRILIVICHSVSETNDDIIRMKILRGGKLNIAGPLY